MNSNDRYIIIFSGYNQRAVLAFLRTLEKNNISKYIIIAKSVDDEILKTNYRSKVAKIRCNTNLNITEIIDLLTELKSKFSFAEYIIAPSTEAINRFVLKYREKFLLNGMVNILVPKELYENVSDKKKFGDICECNGISVPKELGFPNEFHQPFVAKPISYFASNGLVLSPIIIHSSEDYYTFLNNNNIEDYYFQEYIEGQSIYLLYYIRKDGKVFSASQENFMQQPNGKSILVAKMSNFHESIFAKPYFDLLSILKYYGFIMIEVRVALEGIYMIEANPRFWGPSQLFVDSGYNFFECFLQEYGFVSNITLSSNSDVMYYWHGGTKGTNEHKYYSGYGDKYEQELSILLNNDIYNRNDSKQLFEK